MSTKSENWFKKNVKEDEKHIEMIADLSKKALFDTLSITIKTSDVVMALYGSIFETIMDYVKEQQKDKSSYSINIANRLEIGYTNKEDENQEKVGNFMVYMKCLENKGKAAEIDEDETRSVELAAQWNAANVTSNVEAIKEISQRALRSVDDDVDIQLGSLELVIPIFSIIYEQIVGYMKIKRAELDVEELEINLCNLCTVIAQRNDEGDTVIYFAPTVAKKREYKNDKDASGDSVED